MQKWVAEMNCRNRAEADAEADAELRAVPHAELFAECRAVGRVVIRADSGAEICADDFAETAVALSGRPVYR